MTTRVIGPVFSVLFSVLLLVNVASHAVASGHNPAFREITQTLQFDDREVMIVDSLRVNNSNRVRLIANDKCQSQGEAELFGMVSYGQSEEAFAFVPSLCRWIEIGETETRKTVRLDVRLIHQLSRTYGSLVLYHVHPGKLPFVENYFPAYRDLLALALINGQYWPEDRVRVIHRAVTKFGIIEYRFANRKRVDHLVAKLVSTGLGGYIPQNLEFEFMRRKHRDDYLSRVQACAALVDGKASRIVRCFPLITAAFALNFRKRDDRDLSCMHENNFCADQGAATAVIAVLSDGVRQR